VIKSFKSKGLAELWEKGRTGKVDANMHTRILRRLDRLDVAARPEEMNVPGFDFHPLRGFKPARYSVHVNGPRCVTFEFEVMPVGSISSNITEERQSWLMSPNATRIDARPIPVLCCEKM